VSVQQVDRTAGAGTRVALHLTGFGDAAEGVDLSALFSAYGASCYSLARSILRDKDLAQDVVQEAFLEHWRSKAFDASLSTHKRWLLMLTHRKAVDRVRREQRRAWSPLLETTPEEASPQRSPEDAALANVLAPKVREALSALPKPQQQALALAYWGGYTQREIAEMTGTPLGTVKTRMRSGMIALRRDLSDESP
jgi:RNA polymerase sigma-70 factor (ECF subfamily)